MEHRTVWSNLEMVVRDDKFPPDGSTVDEKGNVVEWYHSRSILGKDDENKNQRQNRILP